MTQIFESDVEKLAVDLMANQGFTYLSPEEQELARILLVHLVRVGDDGGPDTKRRVSLRDLPGGMPAVALARKLAEEDSRLLTVDDESDDLEPLPDFRSTSGHCTESSER